MFEPGIEGIDITDVIYPLLKAANETTIER
jgi:hypothetical protein